MRFILGAKYLAFAVMIKYITYIFITTQLHLALITTVVYKYGPILSLAISQIKAE